MFFRKWLHWRLNQDSFPSETFSFLLSFWDSVQQTGNMHWKIIWDVSLALAESVDYLLDKANFYHVPMYTCIWYISLFMCTNAGLHSKLVCKSEFSENSLGYLLWMNESERRRINLANLCLHYWKGSPFLKLNSQLLHSGLFVQNWKRMGIRAALNYFYTSYILELSRGPLWALGTKN